MSEEQKFRQSVVTVSESFAGLYAQRYHTFFSDLCIRIISQGLFTGNEKQVSIMLEYQKFTWDLSKEKGTEPFSLTLITNCCTLLCSCSENPKFLWSMQEGVWGEGWLLGVTGCLLSICFSSKISYPLYPSRIRLLKIKVFKVTHLLTSFSSHILF